MNHATIIMAPRTYIENWETTGRHRRLTRKLATVKFPLRCSVGVT